MTERLLGVFPMIPTPFDHSGAIALDDVERLTVHVLESGAAGVAALGLAGESSRLDDVERMAIAERVIRTAAGSPVIIGTSADSTDTACRLARHAAHTGAAMIMVAPPRLSGLSRSALNDHYVQVAAAAKPCTVMVQDAPGFLNVDLGPAFIRTLADTCANVRAVKAEGAPVGDRIGDMVDALAGTGLPVFGGNGGLHAIDAFDSGAEGMIPGCESPVALVALYKTYASGDRATTVALYERLLPLIAFQLQTLDFYIACNKALLCARGIIRSAAMRDYPLLSQRSLEALFRYARAASIPAV
jgi:4-hydroxy-tetrahydrodipicolinate synthase